MGLPYRPMKVPAPPRTPAPILIQNFLGVDFSSDATVIDNRRSPNMLNMIPDTSGILNKRTGYSKVFTNIIGTNKPIRGMFVYRKPDGSYIRIVSCNSKLYTWNDVSEPVEIYSGVADADMTSFEMNGKIYFQDGTNYLEYDGTTVKPPDPYIPILTMGRTPTGGGKAYQDINLLGSGFKDSFSGVAGVVSYKLSFQNIDLTPVTAIVNGVSMVETTDFIVNRTLGIVTFLATPGVGTDNIIITAYKTISGNSDRIKKCRINTVFGGSNDGRVILSGNPNYINSDWYSGTYDPTYFPISNNSKIGSDSEKIVGYSKQFDYLIIFKENSTFQRIINSDLTTESIFDDKPLNDTIGCIAPKSIAIINNNPVILSNKGIFMLNGGQVRDERNFTHISQRIDPKLLSEPNLQNAVAIDYDNKYYLSVNGNVYVFDYRNMTEPDLNNTYTTLGEWYYWNNINVNCFLAYNSHLYFGSNNIGMLYKIKLESEQNAYNDDGVSIESHWYGKRFNFDSHFYKKNVGKIFITLQPDTRTSADLYYISDSMRSELIETISQYLFNYATLDYSRFSYLASTFPQTKRNKIKAKKIIYFQPILKNNNNNESMGIQAIEIHFSYISEVK